MEGAGLRCVAAPIEVIAPGGGVFFEPGEDYWHGAAPRRFRTHLAMQEAYQLRDPLYWGEHVTDGSAARPRRRASAGRRQAPVS
jgi:hypothetical protein